jgi:hypothetical protein
MERLGSSSELAMSPEKPVICSGLRYRGRCDQSMQHRQPDCIRCFGPKASAARQEPASEQAARRRFSPRAVPRCKCGHGLAGWSADGLAGAVTGKGSAAPSPVGDGLGLAVLPAVHLAACGRHRRSAYSRVCGQFPYVPRRRRLVMSVQYETLRRCWRARLVPPLNCGGRPLKLRVQLVPSVRESPAFAGRTVRRDGRLRPFWAEPTGPRSAVQVTSLRQPDAS